MNKANLKNNYQDKKNSDLYWDSNIKEYEIDPSWKKHEVYKSKKYKEYRDKWSKAEKGKYLSNFPLNIEMEPTYYCNLKCPFCPRSVNLGERKDRHMNVKVWNKILEECTNHKLPSLQMPHESEALMNPNFFTMLKQSNEAGIFDIWLHTNAQMLDETNGRKLIENGLKKINISVDAIKEKTYDILRVGGSYKKLLKNVDTFLKLKKEYNASYLRVRISFVEQKENFSEKKEFFDFWKSKDGVNTITFQRCMDLSPFEKVDPDSKLSEIQLEEKYKNEKPFYCAAPWETPCIQEDGKIAPCLKPVRNHTKDFYIGDISKGDTISDAWQSKKMNYLREIHSKGEWYKVNMCRTCVKVTRNSQHQEFKTD